MMVGVPEPKSTEKEEKIFHSLYIDRMNTAPHISHYLEKGLKRGSLEEQINDLMKALVERIESKMVKP